MSESTACPCTRLIEPFHNGELPDHVCISTMMASVRSAIRDGVVPPSEEWPVLLDGRRLGLVIREWAQEAPNRTLAKMLADMLAERLAAMSTYMSTDSADRGQNQGENRGKDWVMEVESLRAHFNVWREHDPETDLAGWVDGTAWTMRSEDTLDPGAGRDLGRRLRQSGLPDTPSTVRHLRAVAAGVESPPLPARGLLVTTFVFVKAYRIPTTGDPNLFFDANPSVSITGPLELTTGPVFDEARDIALRHQRWLRKLRKGKNHPLSEREAIRRAQPGAFQASGQKPEEWFSYQAVALEITPAELRRRARAHENGSEGAITDYLNEVYRCVKKRHSDGRRPAAAPPRGWRDTVRPQLRQLLKSSD